MSGARTPARRKVTAREAAELLGCSPRRIRAAVAEPREEYIARAAERRENVMALRAKGLKYREIADELGISIGTVSTIIHHAKLKQAS
ncbi:sigma factor-like helix-turn-helix DNA-binding protein (plasmid) [Pseudarthrobacter sp. P1]|uniref:sigma factor-like helix-turn-helix DNA-binding protein n=1 Tax=Pseudarthrobacter sp. P1 TaxID=3418418 RepID=UPI003CF6DE33